ncbi:MAG: primosomal protein N' [Lachnospiraceae bacterium]|nr:primosomal protein N' [Lachnospiraceae bacterium]
MRGWSSQSLCRGDKLYADVIVNLSVKSIDRPYTYRIPADLEDKVVPGTPVMVPFGNGGRVIKGFVIGVRARAALCDDRIKDIGGICEKSNEIEEKMLVLAAWMKEQFGSTMNEAIRCCVPVKDKIENKTVSTITAGCSREILEAALGEAVAKKRSARARLYEALLARGELDRSYALKELKVTAAILRDEEEKGLIRITTIDEVRGPYRDITERDVPPQPTPGQKEIIDSITSDLRAGLRSDYLIFGETGSGKTEIYMNIISECIASGKQAIMLIPEISLTYQTVSRFIRRFGDRVSIMNSRLSKGERYDQYMRAKNGETDIMIGPRSALFAPFERLGLIVIDEEHETSYKSESSPTYHAREVALERGALEGASVIFGSATPSLESFAMAKAGRLRLFKLTGRTAGAVHPDVCLVDMREELRRKNRTMFSYTLREQIENRLARKEQIMLFLNRRGYSTSVSCRECGTVIKCPHCDVSMTLHGDGRMICHYCGYNIERPTTCPECGSRYIGTFGAGTQKIEEELRKVWPQARILRLDSDSVRRKGSMDETLKAFERGEADILLGTQMIVKGHDFPGVTLVGILLADLSLYSPDIRAGERTFELIAQASGRAGRGAKKGMVVIQTYDPENYAIISAARRDYEGFFEEEMAYRIAMGYPPAGVMLAVSVSSEDEKALEKSTGRLADVVRGLYEDKSRFRVIGPAKASLYKIKDVFHMVIYVKSYDGKGLRALGDELRDKAKAVVLEGVRVEYSFNV